MIAAITIPLTLIVLYVLHMRREARWEAATNVAIRAGSLANREAMEALTAQLHAIATKPDPEPIDLSPFQVAQETVHALNRRMDTINDDLHELRTRVEVGAGKRILSL